MARLIEADRREHRPAEALTVFLGDYIDHGPETAAVLDRLARGDFPTAIVTLRGNHEQSLLDGLEKPSALRKWLGKGGRAAAASYGLKLGTGSRLDLPATRDALLKAMPGAHLAFLRETALQTSVGDYFFCHAGIEPGVPLDRQTPRTLMNIRRPFHGSKADHGKVVVHGHTPVGKPDVRPNRINIDTGAFKTGRLTCLVLQDDSRTFLTT